MARIETERGWIQQLADEIKAAGFRVFIAESGTYGFYTDAEGSRVISFGIDLLRIRFSGNYKTSSPSSTGTGWGVGDNLKDYRRVFDSYPPSWAVGGASWKFATMEQYLNTYQKSSKYTEV